MYPWIVYIHVLATFAFLLTHGVSSVVTLRLRGQRDPALARAWMLIYYDNGIYYGALYSSLLVLLLTGIVSAFMGKWWGHAWVWLSLALLIGIIISMTFIGAMHYTKVRKALGMPYLERWKPQPAIDPAPPEEIAALLANSPAITLAVIGFGGIAVILWLMMFKPF
ncbi:MAG: hypothetical protein KA586_10480 [Candidatus Promineofilum sp.]|nr:hypothetical protein [Promineifilum sp.]